MKTDIEIKTDVFKHIQNSALMEAVTGQLRKTGKRPMGSKKEDIVISMLANENGQIQKATVNVNIYVAANVVKGQAEEKTTRLQELCSLASTLFNVFYGDGYRARLLSQRVMEVEGTDEHIINNKIEYKQNNE